MTRVNSWILWERLSRLARLKRLSGYPEANTISQADNSGLGVICWRYLKESEQGLELASMCVMPPIPRRIERRSEQTAGTGLVRKSFVHIEQGYASV